MTANVFCTARDEVRAVRLLDELEEAGFATEQVSMVIPQRAITGLLPRENDQGDGSNRRTSNRSPLPEALARLSQENFSHFAEFGQCVGAGPLAFKLMAIAAAEADDLVSDLGQAGVPSGDLYARRISENRILLSVHCDSLEETERVHKVLTRAGAEDLLISGATSSQDPGYNSYNLRHAA